MTSGGISYSRVHEVAVPHHRIRAAFIRGGTSKAVVFCQEDLPASRSDWDPIFLAIMGSPDRNGRQLDGMGGGLSSVSKVCVVGPPSRSDADVDYTFAQVSVKDSWVDYSGNCGNMSSAIGPFAIDERMVALPNTEEAVVRIHNTNTAKIIVSRFKVADGMAVTDGDLAIDGVSGTSAPIRLEFTEPGGSKSGRLLPSGQAVDMLDIPGLGPIEASLIDAANPCVFVRARDLSLTGTELPDALDADSVFLERMAAIRCAGSIAMGLAADREGAEAMPSAPRVAMLAEPQATPTLSGRQLEPTDMDIIIRMISIGQPHRAVPITGATCLAVGARVVGSIPHQLAGPSDKPIRIAHPSGIVVVDARVDHAEDPATAHAVYGALYRTSRRLFDGNVYYRTPN
jgi:2-methylaconitate isomerase